MTEIICNITVKRVGSNRIKIQVDFPIHAANVGECMQLAQVLNSKEIHNLVVKKHVNISQEVITSAILKDGLINGKRIKAQIYVGILSLRKFIIKNGSSRVSLVMHWGNDRDVAEAEACLNRLMPRPYQPA
jgi:hypothetical protein